MSEQPKNPKAGEMVILTGLPSGFVNDLPKEDQLAISGMVGKAMRLNRYADDGSAELEFVEEDGTIHFIYVNASFVKSAEY
jgi:hypothetical protein